MSRELNAIALTAIMVLSLFAGGTAAVAGIAQQIESTAPTEITSCTVIDSPGHYELTQDVVRSDDGDDPCIEIRASDVTLDGNGHTLDGNTIDQGTDRYGVATTAAHPVDNVTVTNITVRDSPNNIRFEAVTDARITNVSTLAPESNSVVVRGSDHVEIRNSHIEGSFTGNGLYVSNSEHVSVVNNTFSDGDSTIIANGMNRSEISDNSLSGMTNYGLNLESGSGNVIANNTVESNPYAGIEVGGTNNTVVGNTIGGNDGLVLSGANHTVANNDGFGSAWAVTAEGVNHTFRNNDLHGGDRMGGSGGALRVSGSGYVIENNSLSGYNTVYVASATGPVSLRNNTLSGVRELEVAETNLCPDPGVVVTVHGNVFKTDYPNYDMWWYGIINNDDDVVNATGNYWGNESGPSSPDGENVTDPVTGEPADGDGMPVSEGVHFDPYVEQPPENAGAENGTDS